ncbi:MAG: FtsX-like permease family protein [Peptococcaceae bacterium]|nr:FtsX-like permease family protein [Peptococcaceae bacterium]
MALPFENDTQRLEQRMVKRSLEANRRRNLLTGLIVFGAAFILSFAQIFACNASLELQIQTTVNNSREAVTALLALALVVLLAAGLAIKNIMYLSVLQRTREFAQLRTLGATNRQIRRIVAAERRRMTRSWLVAGVLLGFMVNLFLPVKVYYVQSAGCAVAAALFIWLVVYLSFRTPAKQAASLSPMDGLKQTRAYQVPPHRHSVRQSPTALGRRFLASDRKKTVLTMASLIFSGALLFVVFSVISAVNIERMAAQSYYDDSCCYLLLNSTAEEDSTYRLMNEAPFTDALYENIVAVSGVARITPSKMLDYAVPNSDLDGAIESVKGERFINDMLIAGTAPQGGVKNNTIPVILNEASPYYKEAGLTLSLGDEIKAQINTGTHLREVTFDIVGLAENKTSGIVFYTSNAALESLAEMDCTLAWYIVAERGEEENVVKAVQQIAGGDDHFSLNILADDYALLSEAYANVRLIAAVFTGLIMAFAFLNLLNTCITNSLVRQKDFALLEAVGMTRRQLAHALAVENGCYLGVSLLGSWLIGGGLGWLICEWLSDIPGLGYIEYHFPLVFLLCYALFAAIVYCIVQSYQKRQLVQRSVVERLDA